MKDKANAFFYKLKDIILESISYIFCSFIGIIINIFIVFGIVAYSTTDYSVEKLINLLETDEILFSVLSSIAGVLMSIVIYYYNAVKKRNILFSIILFTILFSIMLSVIALIQSQLAEFFPRPFLAIGTLIMTIFMFMATMMSKYDEKSALHEKSVQETADFSKSINKAAIQNQEIEM